MFRFDTEHLLNIGQYSLQFPLFGAGSLVCFVLCVFGSGQPVLFLFQNFHGWQLLPTGDLPEGITGRFIKCDFRTMGFIKSRWFFCFAVFRIDNVFSGTNFDRPEFVRMIEAVKSGKIQCVVVKDLSRFGRDYLETGYYIETIFPLLNVRFIAIVLPMPV